MTNFDNDFYRYEDAMRADILEYIRENFTDEEIREQLQDYRFRWEDQLRDDLWTVDSVTGNASGSYWFNRYKAEQAIAGNWDLLEDALSEFCCDGVNAISKGAEWCDVTIRCYLLGGCLADVLDDLEEQIEEEEEAEA